MYIFPIHIDYLLREIIYLDIDNPAEVKRLKLWSQGGGDGNPAFQNADSLPRGSRSNAQCPQGTHSHLYSSSTVAHILFWLSEAFRFPSGAQSYTQEKHSDARLMSIVYMVSSRPIMAT